MWWLHAFSYALGNLILTLALVSTLFWMTTGSHAPLLRTAVILATVAGYAAASIWLYGRRPPDTRH